MTDKIIMRERIYIPVGAIDVEHAKNKFTKHLFNDAGCSKCEFRAERPCGDCEGCENYVTSLKMYKMVENSLGEFIGLPVGSQRRIRNLYLQLEDLDVEDRRAVTPFKHPIKFTGTLRDYQEEPCAAMYAARYGLLESPPRSGKTVMVTYLVCKFGYKAIIMAGQRDWLNGFYETICGSEDQVPLTNAPDLEFKHKRKIVGFPKTLAEFDQYDICLVTYQTFLSEGGKRLLKQVRSKFGVLFIDESDNTGSTEFAKIVSEFNCRHRYGVTGTVDRKDGRDIITKTILGPVQHVVELKGLVPDVNFTLTDFKKQYKTWNNLLTALAKDEDRNTLILQLVKHYYKRGHSIVIPVWRKNQVALLVDMINKAAGKEIATGFIGNVNDATRKKVITAMRQRKLRVIVGIRKILSRGINIPTLSCLIVAAPISNPPNFKQETSRILTPMPDKIKPVIHHLIDDAGGLSIGCFRNCVLNTYVKNKWHIKEEDWALIRPYIQIAKGRTSYDDDIGTTPAVGRPRKKTFADFAAERRKR